MNSKRAAAANDSRIWVMEPDGRVVRAGSTAKAIRFILAIWWSSAVELIERLCPGRAPQGGHHVRQ